jgi:capsular exopolysaccharide synthesis family protein
LVVSADPQEGKSTIVANLAYSITQAGKKVVIIDGDLRRPKMHNIFHIPNEVGLSNILADDLGVDDALQMTEAGIFVIPSGPIPPDPILLLDCEKVAGLMTELRKQYDTILVDAPSLLAVPDAKLLAHHVDGLIMVINRAATSEDTLQLGLEYIKDMHAEPIGIVINRAEIIDGYYLYH